MCELFGVNANKKVDVNFTWQGFVRKGKLNPHGWGVGWYLTAANGKRAASLVKQPIPAYKSRIAPKLNIKSQVIISHVRYATSEINYLNTHPFVRRIWSVRQYDEWIFAHNGVLDGVDRLPKRFKPLGTTDSEAAFCYIMENLEGIGTIRELFTKLYQLLNELSDYGTLNVLISNGRYLFAYHHHPRNKMWLLKRHPPHKSHARLFDEDFEVSIGDVKAEDEYAYLVATKKLTDENWEKLEKKKLYIFRDGALLLKIGRKIEPMLDSEAIEVLRAVLNGESVEVNETVKRLVDLRLLKITENGVAINNHREAIVKLIVREER
ncbi:class II glutamine amidotransferase [Pyrococcus yayanosii]|uniref:Class II glutamine amidotransferase domain protein n=1 Tax=Pyrococcus yayanosii (strain CH1 / JCM 16557) TaxID=529709 RepID=F8AGI8_PYRYC|nr:class II glutamine amidotransferase [Pyrococcus yayanosii]AEH25192.1 class II glutamine amidotransferase domain protein [Pyrococcus yayanosii CH1]